MALVEESLFGTHDKVATAIQRLRTFEPPEGYFLSFSGGKDSVTAYHLCKEAGVKFDAHYSHTTVDPPELIYFMRQHYGYGVEQDYSASAEWFARAVEGNSPFAAYALGGQYYRGQGVEQDFSKAFSLFTMAATDEKKPNAYRSLCSTKCR